MTHVLHRDYETRSPVDLKATGQYVYFEHPDTDVWLCRYAVDDGEVKWWSPGDPVPPEFIECAANEDWVAEAHNDSFERLCEHFVMAPRYGFPETPLHRHRCTMVKAYAMALPGALEHLGPALNTGFNKDMAGHRLMLAMSRPRNPRKGEANDVVLWRDSPEDKQRLGLYCGDDVEAERAAGKRLLNLRPSEQSLWHLDQTINDRGICVDVDLARRSLAVVEAHTKLLDKAMAQATDYEVTACSNVGQLKTYLKRFGVFSDPNDDSLAKAITSEILARVDLDPRARRALELRQEGGKASVSKIDALLNGMSADGRARGLTQFHAASTGRWAGRRFQPQNIVKPGEEFDIDGAIDVILKNPTIRAMALLDSMYGPPITCVSYTLRGMVKAPKGKKIVAADYSAIEGRVLAWLAGETWKTDYFREYDAGNAPDAYIKAYCQAFNVPVFAKKDPRRQLGKIMELASGFQGGHGAYLAMIPNDAALAAITATTKAATSADVWDAAADLFEGQMGLPEDQWVALRILIDRWRAAHPKVKGFWSNIEAAAVEAVDNPGRGVVCGPVQYKVVGSFLFCQLPSGRALAYPMPKICEVKTPWGQMKDVVTFKTVPNISNTKKIVRSDKTNTPKWSRISTYGGSLVENITQAVARDILAEGMVRLERHGYPVVLHVHDEAVSEVDEGFGSAKEYEQIMSELPSWASGLPVAASGFESSRYRK